MRAITASRRSKASGLAVASVVALVMSCSNCDKRTSSSPLAGAVYRVYVGNTPIEQAKGRAYARNTLDALRADNWAFVGQAMTTKTFEVMGSYEYLILMWDDGEWAFDAIENLKTGGTLGFDRHGKRLPTKMVPLKFGREGMVCAPTGYGVGPVDDLKNLQGPADGKPARAYRPEGDGGRWNFIWLYLWETVEGTPSDPGKLRVVCLPPGGFGGHNTQLREGIDRKVTNDARDAPEAR